MQGEGVELAPLRGSIILDLSSFDDAIEQIESRIESLTDSLRTAFEDINPEINITTNGGFESEIEEVEQLSDAIDETSSQVSELGDALNEASDRVNDLSSAMDEMNDRMSSFGGMARENAEESENWGDHMWETGMEMIFVGQEVSEGLESVTESGMAFQASMLTGATEFGQYYSNVANWAENACNTIGLSYEQSMSLAEQFGLAMRNYGASATEAGKYSEALVNMSAQIRNATGGTVDYDEAADAFRAALGGQMFSLESLGISVTTAQENQLALNSAWHKAYKSLDTYQKKVILIDAIQQDLNKTFGKSNVYMQTSAGRIDTLTAKLHNNLQLIGLQLLPTVIGVLKDFNATLSTVSTIASYFPLSSTLLPALGQIVVIGGAAVIALGVLGKAFSIVGSTSSTAIAGIGDFIRVLKGVDDTEIVTKFGQGFLLVKNVAVSSFSVIKTGLLGLVDVMTGTVIPAIGSLIVAIGPIGWTLIGITTAVVLFYEAWKHNWLNIRNITKDATTDIGTFFDDSEKDISNFTTNTIHLFNAWGKDALSLITDAGHSIEHFLNTNWFLAPIIHTGEALFKLLNSLAYGGHEIVTDALNDLFNTIDHAGESVFHCVSSWLSKTFLGFTDNTEKITKSNQVMYTNLSNDTREGLDNVGEFFTSKWNSITTWFNGAVIRPITPYIDMFTHLLSITNNAMQNLDNSIQDKWDNTCNWFGSNALNLVSDIENLGQSMFNAGVSIITDLGNGIASAWSGLWNSITGDLNSLTRDVDSTVSSITSLLTGSSSNGSHFNGLDYVPFDGYRAELHKGEMVLTEEQAEAYRGNTAGAGALNNMEVHFHSPKAIDPFEASKQIKNLSRKIAMGFY